MVVGALPFLTAMLSSSEQSVQRAALGAFEQLSDDNELCDAVISAGNIVLEKAVPVFMNHGSSHWTAVSLVSMRGCSL